MNKQHSLIGTLGALAVALAVLPGAFAQPPAGAMTSAEDSDTIETVLVRAAREPIRFDSVGGAATLIDGDTLRRRQQAPLGEILRSVPGVAVSRVGVMGSQTQLRLRGSEANHALVLIDGVRANDPAQNDEFNIAHVLNFDIESVEVIRGPQSALWGSDALAGVINIRTASGGASNRGGVFAEGGSNGWQHYGARGGVSTDRIRARASVNSLDTDGENISRSGGEDDGYENLTANLQLDADLSDALRLAATLRYTDATNAFDGTDFSTGLPADADNRTEVQQYYTRISAEWTDPDARWMHRVSYSHTDTANSNRSENTFAPTGFDETRADARIGLLTLQSSFLPAEGQRLTAAYERQEQDFTQRGPRGAFGDPNRDESISIDSFIAEYALEMERGISLLLGARRDRNSDFRDTTTGRASVAWQVFGPDSPTRLRASLGTGVKNPTFTERFGFFTNFVGNPGLEPEESTGWDVGIDQALLNGAVNLSASWFENDLDNEINGFVFDPASGGFTAANDQGRSDRKGLEISGDWQLLESVQLGFAYTWLDATEGSTAGQQREIRRPRHTGNLNLNWAIAAGRGNLNLNADYNGTRDDFYFPPIPPFQERVELDSFVLLTAAGSYELTPRLQLFARVENALDEEYEEVFGFRGMGRTGYVGVRYRFAD